MLPILDDIHLQLLHNNDYDEQKKTERINYIKNKFVNVVNDN